MSSTTERPGAIETAEIEDTSLLAFYRDMNEPERRTFWACAGGWALDGMDFMIYPLVIGTIITMWKVDPGTAGLAGTVTLLASAVGGWLGGYLADRIGRVKTLQLTILWFSVFSLVCAFVQSFDQLLIARALLGLGFGGEWAAGAVLMGESIRAQYRGRAVGSVQSGWAVGWGFAVLAQAVLFSYLPPDTAWRWMFAIGALPAVMIFFLRHYVEEPEIAAATLAKQNATGERPGLHEIFSGPILKTTILASLAITGCQGGYYAVTFWVPRFLTTERKLSVVSSTGYLAALIIGSFAGYLVGAWLADKIGRRNLFLYMSLGAIAIIVAYTQLPLTNEILWVLGFPLGFFASAYFSGVGAFLTELYPTRLRGLGPGLLLQFRPRHRRVVSFPGRRVVEHHLARQRDRDLRGAGLWVVLPRGVRAAGDARPGAARGWVRASDGTSAARRSPDAAQRAAGRGVTRYSSGAHKTSSEAPLVAVGPGSAEQRCTLHRVRDTRHSPPQCVRAAFFERSRVGWAGVDALEKRHCFGMTLFEAGARGGGFQRKAHLDVGGREFVAGKPLALAEFALPERHMLLELRIDQSGQRLIADLAHQRPQQRRRALRHQREQQLQQ